MQNGIYYSKVLQYFMTSVNRLDILITESLDVVFPAAAYMAIFIEMESIILIIEAESSISQCDAQY